MQVQSGNFESLRSLKSWSSRGVPFAMFWWGTLLDHCIFGRCDEAQAQMLFLRAALAGYGRAKANLFAAVRSRAELDDLVARLGIPSGGFERVVYAIKLIETSRIALSLQSTPAKESQARSAFLTIATKERQLGLLAELVALEGPMRWEAELQAISNSGYPELSEAVLQHDMIKGVFMPGAAGRGFLERAQAGDLGVAAAYCDRSFGVKGNPVLSAGLLKVCEHVAEAGFPGAVRALVRHHHATGNRRAAEYFIGLCDALIGMWCAHEIHSHFMSRREESTDLSAKAELWDLAAVNISTARFGLRWLEKNELLGRTERMRRALFVLRFRTRMIIESCLTAPVGRTSGMIETTSNCPWRMPIEIPTVYLNGAR
jgi:hypothetical protein